MGHVLGLPGCFVRGASRAEVVDALPSAVRDYQSWLRRHDEGCLDQGLQISIEVAEEVIGTGPFDPGDPAALFSAERSPITPVEIEDHLRLTAYSRFDLLSAVANIPDEILDWRQGNEFSLRVLLHHIGNAEEFYISRLFAPDQLPQEWAADDKLPILEFLDVERRGCLECLRGLDGRQRSEVFRPAHFTDYPEEEWTARKVLRRFVEHEREHTHQARAIRTASPNGQS
jgi:uncharacterized damage-inducible protein DinB